VERPLEVVQIDHTLADIILVIRLSVNHCVRPKSIRTPSLLEELY